MQRKCICMTCAKALPDQWQVAEIACVPLQLSGDNKVLTLHDEGDCQQLIRALQVSRCISTLTLASVGFRIASLRINSPCQVK